MYYIIAQRIVQIVQREHMYKQGKNENGWSGKLIEATLYTPMHKGSPLPTVPCLAYLSLPYFIQPKPLFYHPLSLESKPSPRTTACHLPWHGGLGSDTTPTPHLPSIYIQLLLPILLLSAISTNYSCLLSGLSASCKTLIAIY